MEIFKRIAIAEFLILGLAIVKSMTTAGTWLQKIIEQETNERSRSQVVISPLNNCYYFLNF